MSAPPTTTPVTVRQVAQAAGVSVGTVSRVLNGYESVSPANRQRVQAAMQKLNYQHTPSIWSPPKRRPLTKIIIAPVNRDTRLQPDDDPRGTNRVDYFVQQALQQNGFELYYQLIDPEQMSATLARLAENRQQCDGLLLLSGICNAAVAQALKANQCPHVCFDARAEQYAVNTIGANAAQAMRQAVTHLYDLGHRQIGFLGHVNSSRYPLVVSALAQRQLPLQAAQLGPTLFPRVGRRDRATHTKAGRLAMQQWIQAGLNATALICSNDHIAFAAMDVLREHGITPGKDIAIVGYDNIEQRGPTPADAPILTTFDNPLDRFGQRMTELLLNQILYSQFQIVHESLPAPLIVRQTTGPCTTQPHHTSPPSSAGTP